MLKLLRTLFSCKDETRYNKESISRIRKEMKEEEDTVYSMWNIAKLQSKDYELALGFIKEDMVRAEDRGGLLRVELAGDECILMAKNLCTPKQNGYGEGWKTVVQSRLKCGKQYKTGEGTSFFTVADDKTHEAILKALEEDNYKTCHDSVWP